MTIVFGNHLLDTEARRLIRGRDEVHLAPKAFELLKLLVEPAAGAEQSRTARAALAGRLRV